MGSLALEAKICDVMPSRFGAGIRRPSRPSRLPLLALLALLALLLSLAFVVGFAPASLRAKSAHSARAATDGKEGPTPENFMGDFFFGRPCLGFLFLWCLTIELRRMAMGLS